MKMMSMIQSQSVCLLKGSVLLRRGPNVRTFICIVETIFQAESLLHARSVRFIALKMKVDKEWTPV